MKIEIKEIKLKDGNMIITPTKKTERLLSDIVNDVTRSKKPYTAEFKKKRKSRSINANNYCWALCEKLAIKHGLIDKEVYRLMLEHYAPRWSLEVNEQGLKEIVKIAKYYKIASVRVIKDVTYSTVVVLRGSSLYDSKEMSRLVNGLVEECELQGIETKTKEEIDRMVKQWKENS